MPILLKRSLTTGSIPTTSSLQPGEIAVNVPDGRIYIRQSGSLGNTVRSIPVLGVSNSGSLILTGSIIAQNIILPTTQSISPSIGSMYFSGSFIYVYDGTQYRSASLN